MASCHMLTFAVLGSASESEESPVATKARHVGRVVATHNQVLMTGGCPGIPHAALRGALEAGGLTVAVSPAANREEHRTRYGYPLDAGMHIFTGMGTKGRNVILVRSADACVFIGGGTGTLNEFTIAFDELGPRRAIGILTGSGGLIPEMARLGTRVGRSPRALVVQDSNAERLVELLLSHCQQAVLRRPRSRGSAD